PVLTLPLPRRILAHQASVAQFRSGHVFARLPGHPVHKCQHHRPPVPRRRCERLHLRPVVLRHKVLALLFPRPLSVMYDDRNHHLPGPPLPSAPEIASALTTTSRAARGKLSRPALIDVLNLMQSTPIALPHVTKSSISAENGTATTLVPASRIIAGSININSMLFPAPIGSTQMAACPPPSSFMITCMLSSCFADRHLAPFPSSFSSPAATSSTAPGSSPCC
ncbi:hypothetical protein THAR02_10902, partial [Trichoderma harzianum]